MDRYKTTTRKGSVKFDNSETFDCHDLINLFDIFLNKCDNLKFTCYCFNKICRLLKIDTESVFNDGHILNDHNETRLIYKIFREKFPNNTNNEKFFEFFDSYLKNMKNFNLKNDNQKQLNILIIGCGPVGLRLSIECALLGHKCTIIEKRAKFTRNNILRLWPYTVLDLKKLGVHLFNTRLCKATHNHISIKALQNILLKIALLLGVRVFSDTTFEEIIPPESYNLGWAVKLKNNNKGNNLTRKLYYDAIIGSTGNSNVLPGFDRIKNQKNLLIGITANFKINKSTMAEKGALSSVDDQGFFDKLKEKHRIDLEFIIHYKGDTNYFAMTVKKNSLLEKGVMKTDNLCCAQLFVKENIDFEKLCSFAKEASEFYSEMGDLEFELDDLGRPDVMIFDFSSFYRAKNSIRIEENNGKKLLLSIVGDCLIEVCI